MTHSSPTPKQQLVDAFERETDTTQKILLAYPADQSELKPHERSKSARELAWMFTLEQALLNLALRNELKLPMSPPATPSTWREVVDTFDKTRKETLTLLRGLRDDELYETTRFLTGPKTVGDVPKVQFAWFLLCDQIHHRGQLSVYLRMAGGKVPSIYGPSADEPWT